LQLKSKIFYPIVYITEYILSFKTVVRCHSFNGIDWEAPFQKPFFKVIESFLDRVGSFQRIRGVRPDGEIISIKWVFGLLR